MFMSTESLCAYAVSCWFTPHPTGCLGESDEESSSGSGSVDSLSMVYIRSRDLRGRDLLGIS